MLENVFPRAFRARNFLCLLAVTALTACGPAPVAQGINDPYEQTNRSIHQVNVAVDRNVVRPVSRLFGDGEGFVLRRAKNFAGNLSVPGTVVNNLLQLRITDAGQNTLRFAVNSTFGLAGLFDPAGTLGVAPKPTDFGETLHVWGVGEGPYMELPLAGPSTARDTVGMVADSLHSRADGVHSFDFDDLPYGYDPDDLRTIRAYDPQDRFICELPCRDDMVLEYGANRESIQAAMHELRGYTKLVKNAAEAQAGKITEVYGEAKAFDVCLAKAQQNIEARITAPENAKPPVVELQFANEGEPLLQAVGAEHLVDFGRMTANAIKQHEQEGSFEDENL